MKADPIYLYNLAGRRPATMFALALTVAMIAFALAYNAPAYFFAPLILALAMMLWAIIANQQTGVRLTAQTLHIYSGRHMQNIAVCNIRSVTIENHIDGGPSANLILLSGEKVGIPAICMNRDLGTALESLGITVSSK